MMLLLNLARDSRGLLLQTCLVENRELYQHTGYACFDMEGEDHNDLLKNSIIKQSKRLLDQHMERKVDMPLSWLH